MKRALFFLPLFLLATLFLQPVLAQTQWQVDGSEVSTASGNELDPTIAPDGVGGAIITWEDDRNGTYDIYAQRIDASGAAQWTPGGVALCRAAYGQTKPTIVADGAGGAIVVWQDGRGFADSDIYAQRVDASGSVQWTAGGVAVCTAVQDQLYPAILAEGAGGAIVTWQDARDEKVIGSYGTIPDIYAQRIDASGATQWTANGIPLCTATNYQEHPRIVSDGAGGAIVTWYDYRSDTSDVYAQRVSASGTVQWTSNGVGVCTATGSQYYPAIVSDETGGAIVTWHDYRNGSPDIYAQRIDASGTAQWMANGVPVCTAGGTQFNPSIVSDGAGGAIVAWRDDRSGSPTNHDVYAQRIDASGAVQWTINGVGVCTQTEDQDIPSIVSDGAGGVIATWRDRRSGIFTNYDIYAQRVSASGALQWAADGVALCTAANDQNYPTIVSDGSGGAIVTWEDDRSDTTYDVYAQRVEDAGATGVGDTPPRTALALQTVPNPFASATTLEIGLPAAARVRIEVYDVAGRRVRTMDVPGVKGLQAVPFASLDDHGTPLASGVYFCRVLSGGFAVTRKMVIAR